jgi:hypothetical protein
MITRLFLHSDNAAQRYPIEANERQRDMVFISVMWDFGPPGHSRSLTLTFSLPPRRTARLMNTDSSFFFFYI